MNGNVLMRIYNASDPATGETTLHNYCKYINSTPIEVFKYLIGVRASIFTLRMNPIKPHFLLHLMINFRPNGGNIGDTLIYLLNQNGVNVHTQGQYGSTSLHHCL